MNILADWGKRRKIPIQEKLPTSKQAFVVMNDLNQAVESAAATNPGRRRMLASLLSAYTASLIPWATAQAIVNDNQGAFLAVSAILAGRQSLDTVLAKRLYDALVADDPDFPAAVSALLKQINEQKIAPMQLQKTLDTEHSRLAPLPRKIVSAWFLGIVGDGERARCIAYETALNAVVVEDVLKPPTYAYGAYGSWARKPN